MNEDISITFSPLRLLRRRIEADALGYGPRGGRLGRRRAHAALGHDLRVHVLARAPVGRGLRAVHRQRTQRYVAVPVSLLLDPRRADTDDAGADLRFDYSRSNIVDEVGCGDCGRAHSGHEVGDGRSRFFGAVRVDARVEAAVVLEMDYWIRMYCKTTRKDSG